MKSRYQTLPPPPLLPSLPPSLLQVGQYLELVRRRATGEVMTAASYMRHFVREHPDYKVRREGGKEGGGNE